MHTCIHTYMHAHACKHTVSGGPGPERMLYIYIYIYLTEQKTVIHMSYICFLHYVCMYIYIYTYMHRVIEISTQSAAQVAATPWTYINMDGYTGTTSFRHNASLCICSMHSAIAAYKNKSAPALPLHLNEFATLNAVSRPLLPEKHFQRPRSPRISAASRELRSIFSFRPRLQARSFQPSSYRLQ